MSIGELACTYASDLFEKRSADELYLNVGSGGAHLAVATPAVASGGLGGAALAAAVKEKKVSFNHAFSLNQFDD
ncbi:hypothetical protein WN944_025942 [Citrus x changshan-huyou]|uniref:Uncharacterized protein n=1 Tax=Citrus x changshan-huyou TaxID=2935761 RepID=A0AAP0QCT0_9ROSI